LTLNGPAWSWVSAYQRSRDGRAAWKALITYYEGDAMKMRSKQQCYDAISKANYQGTRRSFDFGSYLAIHQQAHQDLECLGEPAPENKKVRDFLQGITDAQCSNIKLNVLSNPEFMNSFSQAINYIASAIDMISKNTAGSSTRQISEYSTNEGQNNRGRARGGRNGRGARGGRGRGRNNSNNSQGSSPTASANNRPITRGYSREEWQNLSQSERNRIYRARERLETARTIAAMIRGEDNANATHMSTITGTAVDNASQSNGNANNSNSSVSGVTRSINQVSLDNVSRAFTCHRLNAYRTGTRTTVQRREISSLNSAQSERILECRVELDSHADTCGVNNVARILEYNGHSSFRLCRHHGADDRYSYR